MVWFKVSDDLPMHRKVLAVRRGTRRLAAVGGWTLLGSWCSANSTEGLIPNYVLDDLGITSQVVKDLVETHRLTPEGTTHHWFHGFLDYNPTAEQVSKDRAAAAERQRRARERAREARLAAEQEAAEQASSHAVTDPVTSRVTNAVSHGPPGPTRPGPSRTSGVGLGDRAEVEVPARALLAVAYSPADLATWDEVAAR